MSDMTVERALTGGDLSSLTEGQRTELAIQICTALGLNIATSPLAFFRDDATGVVKVGLRKSGTNQLRQQRGISVTGMNIVLLDGIVVFTASGHDSAGRQEVSSGTMFVGSNTERVAGGEERCGEERARRFLLAETKAKSRLTLDLAGLGLSEEPDVRPSVATEPTVVTQPAVNQERATETVDQRHHGLSPALTQEQKDAGAALQTLLDKGGSVPETQPEKIDAELAKQITPITEAPVQKAPAQFIEAGGFNFDEPAPVDEEQQKVAEILGVPLEQVHKLEVVPTETIIVQADARDPKPTNVEFKGFTARCTKLVRDVLPKAGKDVPSLLLPFLKKTFGVPEIQNATVKQWEETLTKLETAGSPQATAAILKGRK